jgi:tRNA-Thr(GGU) m(6)t(6)A37 methyltransferase TsaA
MTTTSDIRAGEVALAQDPAQAAGDANLVFIGRVRTPWNSRADAPKNPNEARTRGGSAYIELDAAFRPGLQGLEQFSHAIVLYWMHEARRDLLVQVPRHSGKAHGTFALRSPVRPNPIALSVVRILKVDAAAGRVDIDAIDCLDGTPLVDIKPYRPGVDAVPDATTP